MASVLLLHGVQSSRDAWWRMLVDLPTMGVRAQAVDLLGHGGRTDGPPGLWTLRDLAVDVADRAEPVDLVVGHSLGGLVALTLAALHPTFARAVLVEDPPDGVATDVLAVADSIEKAVARARADGPGVEAEILADNPAWASLDARHSVAARRRLDVDRVAALMRGLRWDLRTLVRDCPVPVHLLAADGPGSALSEPVRAEVVAALDDRAVAVSSGHSVYRDRPGPWLVNVLKVIATIGV